MNQLTGAKTLVENKLFATLDATIRKIKKNFPFSPLYFQIPLDLLINSRMTSLLLLKVL